MAEFIDKLLFPRTAAYIEQLPEGLDSYPECRAKASIHRTVGAYAEDRITGLPDVLQHLYDDPPQPGTWIPQCQSHAIVFAVAESRKLPRAQENEWVRHAARTLFSTPMYQILMRVASPQRTFKHAHLRWSAFYRGSNLVCTLGESSADVEVTSPGRLFNEPLGQMFAQILTAAITMSEDTVKHTRVEFRSFKPGSIRYLGVW